MFPNRNAIHELGAELNDRMFAIVHEVLGLIPNPAKEKEKKRKCTCA